MHSTIPVSSLTPPGVTPSRRPTSIAAAAVALVLVVAACTGSDPADPQGASSAGSADKPRSGALYPVQPTVDWELTATAADPTGSPDAIFINPTYMAWISFDDAPVDGVPDSGVRQGPWLLELDGALIAAVSDGADLSVGPTLLGIDPASGDPSWAYEGSGSPAQLLACAQALVGDDLACLEEDPAGASEPTSFVVLVDARSGRETGRFEVPARARRIAVTGQDVVVWSTTGPTTADVARYSTSGEPRWSVSSNARLDFSDRIAVGPTAMSLETTHQGGNRELRRVLSLEDGSLLAERIGTASVRMLENGSVLLATLEVGSEGELTLLDPDGADVAELPGHEVLPGIFSFPAIAAEPVGPILVRDGAGAVLELDPATGATTPTEIVVPRPMQPLAATKVGEALLFSDLFSLRRVDPQAPDEPVWETPFQPYGAATDGTLVYGATAEAGSLQTSNPAFRMTAIQLDDGQVAWELPFPDAGPAPAIPSPTAPAFLQILDNRLVVIGTSTLTAYAP